ncbi:integumentary mucin C.1-like [Limanda limanda]|uniref:integumentary mucin C.1-like n=1 Tax=Limanda limanda TaxID=27771 RepID=UPI0029C68C98|nr:integumentary mucin C.1-like [Limanda limanda]
MMKLLLSLTLIWALYSTGEALVCETCTDAACSTRAAVTCSTETMCVTASFQLDSAAVSLGTAGQQIYKDCAPPGLCPSTGSHTYSVNSGVSSILTSATCCSTDSCNSNTLPFPVVPAVNSLQCHVCNPVTSDCSSSVQCKGTEDCCFQGSVTNGAVTFQYFGCASSNLYAAAASLGSQPFMQSFGTNISGLACCGTSLCNTLTTTTTTPTTTTTTPTTTTTASDACCVRMGMLHLLIGLLIFILF